MFQTKNELELRHELLFCVLIGVNFAFGNYRLQQTPNPHNIDLIVKTAHVFFIQ